jgi:GNAT superfamily N-acetyltransferase
MWFMDRALARRLERTEGAMGASFTGVHHALAVASATWRDFDGTYAIFDGPESPMTQTFGLGVFAPTSAGSLAVLEAFFAERGAPALHEVSPLAGIDTIALLVARGYQPIELSTVLVQAIEPAIAIPSATGLRVRVIGPADDQAWIDTSVLGWSDDPAVGALVGRLAAIAVANDAMLHFIVDRDGAPIATASMGIHDGVALLAGASTVPAGRGLGAQAMLLAARLSEARKRGCEIAMMVTDPGSTSQRNAERRGFRVAYTRTKWRRERSA